MRSVALTSFDTGDDGSLLAPRVSWHVIGPAVTISVLQMIPLLRRAQRGDVGAMQRIRASVKENRLTSRALSEADYLQAIENEDAGG